MNILEACLGEKRFELLSLNVSLDLKILLEVNTGDQSELRLLSLSSYVQNYYRMNTLQACLGEKQFE